MHSSLPWFSTFAGDWRTFSGRSRRGPTATLGVVQMREARVETAIGTRPRADGAASRRPLETRLNVLATNRSVVLHAAKDTRASHEHPTCTGTFYTNDEHAPVAAGHWIPARGSLNCQRTLVPFGQPAIHAPPLFPFWRGGQLCGAFLLPPAPPKVPWARRAGRLGSRRWRRPRQAGWAGLGWAGAGHWQRGAWLRVSRPPGPVIVVPARLPPARPSIGPPAGPRRLPPFSPNPTNQRPPPAPPSPQTPSKMGSRQGLATAALRWLAWQQWEESLRWPGGRRLRPWPGPACRLIHSFSYSTHPLSVGQSINRPDRKWWAGGLSWMFPLVLSPPAQSRMQCK